MDVSIVSYYGIQASRCGYCKGTKCSKAHGMHAYTMTPQDYQDLIDRGWRRSGEYCYKPHNSTTCCPSYTIKCDALEFKLTKSHKKILKRMNRFLRDGKKDKNEAKMDSQIDAREAGDMACIDEPKAPNVPLPKVDLEAVKSAKLVNDFATNRNGPSTSAATSLETDEVDGAVSAILKKQPRDNITPPRKKAKQMRLERRQAKLEAKGEANAVTCQPANSQQKEKSLTDFIAETAPTDKHKLKIVLTNATALKVEDQTFNLYRKYQMLVHNDAPERLTPNRLERFLYNSPLKHDTRPDGPPQGYGSFHQQYWLDDKLIAVGVIDILPYCLSSVYFFYDPDYSFLSMGTYASLREIEFVQQLSQLVPDLKYYYMGFYIQSCPKMRYKGKLVPSYLVCPETYTWHLLTDEIRNLLDACKYQRFNTDPAAKDKDEFTANDLNRVILLLDRNKCGTYGQFIELHGEDAGEHDMILEYGKFVGKPCAHRMIYVAMC